MDIQMEHYRKRLIAGLVAFGILALGVIPVYTLIMGTQANIFEESMSFMGNIEGNRFWFILWTILFSGFFSSFVIYILMLTRNTHSKIRVLVYIATGTLIFGNIVPFIPEYFPALAELHNFCAQISSISLAIVIVLLALTLRKLYPVVFKKAIFFAFIIWGVLLALISLFGTVSFTEMTSIILGSIYLFAVTWWLFKQEDFDPVKSLQENDLKNALEETEKLKRKTEEAQANYLALSEKLTKSQSNLNKLMRLAKTKKH